MNLLQEFEGLFGEVLASAALRVIVLSNPRARNAVIDVLSAASLRGPFSSNSHFACHRELGTKSEKGETGRLDLVLEMDDAIVGIEAKFTASFQPQQPEKYQDTLRLRAELLSKLRSSSVEPQLFVVAPRSRRGEAQKHAPDYAFVAWEELIEAVGASSIGHDAVLERDFASFVQSRLEFLPRLERDLPHLTRFFPPRGSKLQCTFLSKIYCDALRRRGGKLSRGPEWCGYYLSPVSEVWLGFRPSEDGQSPRGASLTLASLEDFALADPPFRRFEPRRPVTLSTNRGAVTARYHWLVSPSLEWRDPEHVRDLFSPVTSVAPPSPEADAVAPPHVDEP